MAANVFVGHDALFDPVIKQQAHDSSGNGADDDLRPDVPRSALLLRVLARRKRVELVEEQQDDGEDGAELNNDQKRAVERLRHLELDEFVQKHHVTRRGDGQPFGDALDDTEQKRFQRFK